eukprot:TRINITY_DN9174_c0_g1_i2.p1 TRINITY_DN9174_c0_g1~~TRINITY_DN9174_c0_g1_i2.p1  ORF type:complete len:557 (+),score=104.17 TRINITY_DN9174_c0_g1_i2:61-1671(+)
MERYTRIKCIGSGTFGEAFLVHDRRKDKQIVLKDVKVGLLSPSARENALNEVIILSSLRHPYIVRYHDSFVANNELHIAMEFCPKGDLHSCIEEQRLANALFPEEQVLAWATQLMLALDYIHSKKILHRDLKSQNVFISRRNHLKLGDFGVSRCLESTDQFASTLVGTPYYLSPELAGGRPYNAKSDCWAAGCILYELLTLEHAFEACNISILLIRINAGHYPSPSTIYDVRLRAYLRKLLTTNPVLRWSAEELLSTDLFRPYVARYARAARPELLQQLELETMLGSNKHVRTPQDVLIELDDRSVPPCSDQDSNLHDEGAAPRLDASRRQTDQASTLNEIPKPASAWELISSLPSSTSVATAISAPEDESGCTSIGDDSDWSLVSMPRSVGQLEQDAPIGFKQEEYEQPAAGDDVARGIDGTTSSVSKRSMYQQHASVAKFMLGSKTLQLEGMAPHSGTCARIEALRAYLEKHLGDELTITAYVLLVDLVYSDGDCDTTSLAEIRRQLGDKVVYLPLLVQLIHAEAFNYVSTRPV